MTKSPDAFRTISEVAEWLDSTTNTLRFWETKFTQVRPLKRAGGRRHYRPSDMELLGGIKKLLYEDGLTIRGVQKILREKGVKHVAALSKPVCAEVETVDPVPEAKFVDVPAAPRPTVRVFLFDPNKEIPQGQALSDTLPPAVDSENAPVTPAAAGADDRHPANPNPSMVDGDATNSSPADEPQRGSASVAVGESTTEPDRSIPADTPASHSGAEFNPPVKPETRADAPSASEERASRALPPLPDLPPDPSDDDLEAETGLLSIAASVSHLAPVQAAAVTAELSKIKAYLHRLQSVTAV